MDRGICDYLKYSHPSGTPLKVQRSLKFESVQLTCIIVRHVEWEKKGPSIDGNVFIDVRMMSVVSDKQKQAGSSGSAPATPQGNNLPPAVPPPSISRNPLRGSKCNNLHFIPIPPLPYPFTFVVRIQRTLKITDTDVSCRIQW